MAVSDFISNGGFGMNSFDRAKAAGYSDLDIYNFLSRYNGTIGDQVRSNMATFNQSQAQSQGGLGLESYNRALASGQTPQQFFDYAKGSGLTIGAGLQAEMDKYAASQARPMQISDAKGVNQALKIAGEGGITRQELNNITETTGKSAATVIKQLDKVNSKLKDANLARIRLNSGAANTLIKQSGPAYGGFYGLTQKPTFGTGNIGKALESMRGTLPSGGYTNPQSGYSMTTPGTAPTLMMGGTQIRGGGRPTVKGFGEQYTYKPGNDYSYTPAESTGTGTGDPIPTTTAPEATAESKFGPGGPGSALDGGATGFRPRRSRWRTTGQASKGTANLKINGQTGRSSGVNLAVS
jgi:hypothetical protein